MVYSVIKKECFRIYTDDDTDIDIEILEFETREEAEYYLKYGKIMDDNESIIVFTDGSCSNNGSINAKAGIGVFFSENDKRNISKRIEGKQTNNTAELSAVIEVFTILKNEIKKGCNIKIYTDSEYVIKCCGSYGEKCEKKGWKNKNKLIPNSELVKEIYELFKLNNNVEILHVKAHTGKQDYLSKGNEYADLLANKSIEMDECPYNSKTKLDHIIDEKMKIYLNVDYSEKNIAKGLGAKWDNSKKKWYYTETILQENKEKLKELFG